MNSPLIWVALLLCCLLSPLLALPIEFGLSAAPEHPTNEKEFQDKFPVDDYIDPSENEAPEKVVPLGDPDAVLQPMKTISPATITPSRALLTNLPSPTKFIPIPSIAYVKNDVVRANAAQETIWTQTYPIHTPQEPIHTIVDSTFDVTVSSPATAIIQSDNRQFIDHTTVSPPSTPTFVTTAPNYSIHNTNVRPTAGNQVNVLPRPTLTLSRPSFIGGIKLPTTTPATTPTAKPTATPTATPTPSKKSDSQKSTTPLFSIITTTLWLCLTLLTMLNL